MRDTVPQTDSLRPQAPVLRTVTGKQKRRILGHPKHSVSQWPRGRLQFPMQRMRAKQEFEREPWIPCAVPRLKDRRSVDFAIRTTNTPSERGAPIAEIEIGRSDISISVGFKLDAVSYCCVSNAVEDHGRVGGRHCQIAPPIRC